VLTPASFSTEEGKQEVLSEPVVPAHPKRASDRPLRDGKLSPSDLPLYVEQFLRGDPPLPFPLSDLKDNEQFYRFVAAWTQQQQEISTSQIQQVFGIGYARASGFMGRLEKAELVGPDLGAGRRRQVLVRQECISPSPEKEEASC
jgi:DNA segregation ATPase FtsK/SpoIIIE-like protein